MGRDYDLLEETIMNGVTMLASGATTTAANGTNTSAHVRTYMDGFCIVGSYVSNTTTSAMTANLQCSIDNSTWAEVASSTLSVAGTGTQVAMWNVANPYYNYVRVHHTTTTMGFIGTVKIRSIGD
jgi:hypothetical protein